MNIPAKIPMIVTPKLYECGTSNYVNLGGYLLNDVEYTDEILLAFPPGAVRKKTK